MNDHNPLSPPPRDRDAARKRAQNHFVVREQRDSAIRQEINRKRADTDAKTEKLRAHARHGRTRGKPRSLPGALVGM